MKNWKLSRGKIIDSENKIICALPRRENNDAANIIAAAPELLSALEWFADELPGIIRQCCPEGVPLSVANATDAAKAAIAKARGEA